MGLEKFGKKLKSVEERLAEFVAFLYAIILGECLAVPLVFYQSWLSCAPYFGKLLICIFALSVIVGIDWVSAAVPTSFLPYRILHSRSLGFPPLFMVSLVSLLLLGLTILFAELTIAGQLRQVSFWRSSFTWFALYCFSCLAWQGTFYWENRSAFRLTRIPRLPRRTFLMVFFYLIFATWCLWNYKSSSALYYTILVFLAAKICQTLFITLNSAVLDFLKALSVRRPFQ